ncbi:Mobile element protein [Pseudomonas chlororaphis subsp. aurantiaca]|nr:Mobile element protein [Pseudomonas chlororaphis subsp. aurantiaca]
MALRLLEKHELAAGVLALINGYPGDRGLPLRQGTIVDARLIHAPSSTRNQDCKRDPQMHQTKKGNPYYFGAKAHIGADEDSGLVHSVVVNAANVADITQVDKLLHGEENECRAEGDAVCPIESVDGPPTFAGQRRRGAPVMRKVAAAGVFATAEKMSE